LVEAWAAVPLGRRPRALAAATKTLEAARAAHAVYDVDVTLYGCSGLPKADGTFGVSDPYVELKMGDDIQRSVIVHNDPNPTRPPARNSSRVDGFSSSSRLGACRGAARRSDARRGADRRFVFERHRSPTSSEARPRYGRLGGLRRRRRLTQRPRVEAAHRLNQVYFEPAGLRRALQPFDVGQAYAVVPSFSRGRPPFKAPPACRRAMRESYWAQPAILSKAALARAKIGFDARATARECVLFDVSHEGAAPA